MDLLLSDRSASTLQQLMQPVSTLAARLAIETKKFQEGQPYDDQVGLELFERAVHGSQEAWEYLYEQYKPLVIAWITRRKHGGLDPEDLQTLIDDAFIKFFTSMTKAKFQGFKSISALLKYLQCCTFSVVTDHARRRTLSMSPLDEAEAAMTADIADAVLTMVEGEKLWQIIDAQLQSDEERLAIYLFYRAGMRADQICQYAPTLFPTVRDVFRVKKRVIERLQRSHSLQKALKLLIQT